MKHALDRPPPIQYFFLTVETGLRRYLLEEPGDPANGYDKDTYPIHRNSIQCRTQWLLNNEKYDNQGCN